MNKYTWLLFDADNTLLDFDGTSALAFKQAFLDKNLPFEDSIYKTYKGINAKLWEALELKQIKKEEINGERFRQLFVELNLDYDVDYFKEAYLQNLITHSFLYDGVIELLQTLQKKYRLGMITNGLKTVQRPRFRITGVYDFFDIIVVSDEINCFKPDPGIFEYAFNEMGNPPKAKTLMLGDKIASDIKGGHDFGIDTCWVNLANKTNETSIQPTYEVKALKDLLNFL